jgi:hypothetical protein
MGRIELNWEADMRFVLIASARTGSDHLTTELGRKPDIWCHDEVFHPKKVFLRWPGWPHVNAPEDLEAELRALRETDPDAFLERVYALNFDRPHVGLRIFERHQPSMLAKIIAAPEIAKIVLIRTNVLANYASKLVAEEVDDWGCWAKRNARPSHLCVLSRRNSLSTMIDT